jgi:hypothetical protein
MQTNKGKFIKIFLISLLVFISGFLVNLNITRAAEIKVEGNKIIIKNGPYRHIFNIQKRIKDESFWVYGLTIGRYTGVDAIYQGNFQLISFFDMPKYKEIFIMLENTFKGKPVAYVYQVSGDKEEKENPSGYRGMLVPSSGKNEANPLDKILNSSVNYFFITGDTAISNKIKSIQKSDIIILKGYIVNLDSVIDNGKKIFLSPDMVDAAHFIIEDVEIVDMDSQIFSFPKKGFVNAFKNAIGIFTPKSNAYKISGIIFAPPSNSLAVINGNKIKEGELLGGVKVKKINKDSVILEIEGKDIVITTK